MVWIQSPERAWKNTIAFWELHAWRVPMLWAKRHYCARSLPLNWMPWQDCLWSTWRMMEKNVWVVQKKRERCYVVFYYSCLLPDRWGAITSPLLKKLFTNKVMLHIYLFLVLFGTGCTLCLLKAKCVTYLLFQQAMMAFWVVTTWRLLWSLCSLSHQRGKWMEGWMASSMATAASDSPPVRKMLPDTHCFSTL